jgi:hypothetical protein
VEQYRERIKELERTVNRVTSELKTSEVKRTEAENHLMTEENVWKTERTALEEKLKKVSQYIVLKY